MAEHLRLPVGGQVIDIYNFIASPGWEVKARGLARVFGRMPPHHLAAVFPIFIIEHKPAQGPGGGTWKPHEVSTMFAGHEHNTRVPDADVTRLVMTPGLGLIGIPRNRWEYALPDLEFTVMHEVGHSVDVKLGLKAPRVAVRDFVGVRPTCGAGDAVTRHAVEAYARFIIRPGGICRDPVPEGNQAAGNRRVIGHLRASPAFRGLPSGWMPA
jgi:hypothetical protein